MVTSINNAISNYVYFTMNFKHDFIKEIWKDDPLTTKSLISKFNSLYEKHGTGVMNFFFCELDPDNRKIFCDWVNANYKGFEMFHEFDKNERERIESIWFGRVKELELKPGTKKYMEEQASFFAGVITALNSYPAYWVLCIGSGRVIEQAKKD